jgi:hypothetical protein
MRILSIAAIGIVLVSAGCVRQQRFRFVPAATACFDDTANVAPAAGPPDQKPSLDCRHAQYKMAFIEFDQQGRAFDANQEAAALKLLDREKARAKGGKIITVVYVHGWKNNASEALPGGQPKDVEKFQRALLELGYRAGRAAQDAGTEAVPVVGVYVGWRGKTLMGPSWFNFVSLWGRRNTANRVGSGPDLAPMLNRIIEKTNAGDGRSRVLMIGHSFGARVLEHAIETKRVTLYDAAPGGAVVNPRVDLVLYVNSANDSRLTMARVQELQAGKVEAHHPDYDPKECGVAGDSSSSIDEDARQGRCRDYPLLVAITSKGDQATKRLLPIANTINGDDLPSEVNANLPELPKTDTFADPLPAPGTYRKVAAGHFAFLQSHVVREITCPALPRSAAQTDEAATIEARIDQAVQKAVAAALAKAPTAEERRAQLLLAADRKKEENQRIERALHPVCPANDPSCRFVFRTLGEQPACYRAGVRPAVDGRSPFNRTPFWIMDVEPAVIKDHGDIWNVSFVEMLGQLMAPRGFFDPGSGRIQLRAPQ